MSEFDVEILSDENSETQGNPEESVYGEDGSEDVEIAEDASYHFDHEELASDSQVFDESTLLSPCNQDTLAEDEPEDSPIKPRRTLQALQAVKMSQASKMSQAAKHLISGVEIQPEPKAIKREKETLHTKSKRQGCGDEERNDLLDKIQKNQQTKFHSITVSVDDPEKMTNAHSIAKLLAKNERNSIKHDPTDPCTILSPKVDSFDDKSPDHRLLNCDINGAPITCNLFNDCLRLTADQAALSTKWHSSFMPEDQPLQEDVNWSLACYENNVEPQLYAEVHADPLDYDPDKRGGPLFLKLLLDRIATTNEANLKALIHITTAHSIKKSVPGETIDNVTDLFEAIYENMESLENGTLPEDSLKNLLTILQTAGVDPFNEIFRDMEKTRLNNEVKASICPDFAAKLVTPGVREHQNDISMSSIKHTLTHADKLHRNHVEDGTWDKCIQKRPGTAAFLAGTGNEPPTPPSKFQDNDPNDDGAVVEWTTPGDCFNCGRPGCRTSTCPLPRDPQRIKNNKLKHPGYHRVADRQKRWRKPSDGEGNKRVIDGIPHTWDPHGGDNGNGWWIEDDAPSDGQSKQTMVNLSQIRDLLGTDRTVAGDASTITTNDPMERKLQIHLHMASLQAELDKL